MFLLLRDNSWFGYEVFFSVEKLNKHLTIPRFTEQMVVNQ